MLQELFAGESLKFTTGGGAYPATDGWTLKYRLVPRSAANAVIEIVASASGSDFLVAEAASTTSTWAADNYTWTSYVEKAGEKYIVQTGQIVVKPNLLSVGPGYDGRSQAHKALDDLRTALATYSASNGMQRRYRIGEREMEFNSSAEIIKLITYWEQQVEGEDVMAGRVQRLGNRIHSRI